MPFVQDAKLPVPVGWCVWRHPHSPCCCQEARRPQSSLLWAQPWLITPGLGGCIHITQSHEDYGLVVCSNVEGCIPSCSVLYVCWGICMCSG